MIQQNLTTPQKKLIEQYVNELLVDRMKLIQEYYDVDKDLELLPSVTQRLRSNKKRKTVSHEEFWNNVL
ncbi:MAG: hypothetical protein FJ218_11225 [Ignavibacteria bacterium]|nr:hypothetical protein [Ignavibacteria bacterium]